MKTAGRLDWIGLG